MSSKLNDLSSQLFEIVIDISDLLLLLEISCFKLPERAIHLNLEISLKLLDMRHYCLLLPIKVSDRLLVLALDKFNYILGLSNHPVVLVIELLHPKDIITSCLLGQLQALLYLLVCPLLKQKLLFLKSLNLLFQLPNRFFVSTEIKFRSWAIVSKGLLYDFSFEVIDFSSKTALGLLDGLLLKGQFAIQGLDKVNLVPQGILDLQAFFGLNFNFSIYHIYALDALIISLFKNLDTTHKLAVVSHSLARVKGIQDLLFNHGCQVLPQSPFVPHSRYLSSEVDLSLIEARLHLSFEL